MNKEFIEKLKTVDGDCSYVDKSVVLGKNVKFVGNNYLIGKCKIGENCLIINSIIFDSDIGDNCKIISSQLEESKVSNNVEIGPFAHFRKGSTIQENARIGNFVEIKNSTIGKGTKIAHLTYVGDATIGENCNLGCGVVFCNYDGKNKHQSFIGNNTFIGSNVNLVAPITIGDDCFIAAGSTVSKNLANKTFCIARSEQREKDNKLSLEE